MKNVFSKLLTINRKLLFIHAISLLIFFGCSNDNSTSVQETQHTFNPIMPLKHDNFWVYIRSNIEYAGKDTIIDERSYGFRLIEEKDNKGYISYFTSGGLDVAQLWLYTDAQGLWIFDKNDDKIKVFAAKYPCQVGDKWKTISEYILDTPMEYTVLSTSERLAVRGKEYTCIHYRGIEIENPERVTDTYYALNIGKVCEKHTNKGLLTYTFELDTFNIK